MYAPGTGRGLLVPTTTDSADGLKDVKLGRLLASLSDAKFNQFFALNYLCFGKDSAIIKLAGREGFFRRLSTVYSHLSLFPVRLFSRVRNGTAGELTLSY
jgi:hypothetical protein